MGQGVTGNDTLPNTNSVSRTELMRLDFLFKPRRASTPRARRRRFVPSVLGLEGRKLLSDIIYTINGPNVVGSHFKLTATDKNFLVYQPGIVKSTTWTIQGAYASPQTGGKTINGATPIDPAAGPSESGGYQYTPLYNITVPGDTIDGYWNGSSGAHVVSTTVTFVSTSGRAAETKSASMNVVAPTGNIWKEFTNTLDVGTDWRGKTTLTTAADPAKGQGIELGFRVDATSPGATGGRYGIVQTIDARTYREYELQDLNGNVVGSKTDFTPTTVNMDNTVNHIPTLLDATFKNERFDEKFTPYYGTFVERDPITKALLVQSQVTWDVGGPDGKITDSPDASFGPKLNDTELAVPTRLVDTGIFTDTLMFTPPGGIAVPLGSLKWAYSGDAYRTSTGAFAIDWSTSTNPHVSSVYSTATAAKNIPTWDNTTENTSGKNTEMYTNPITSGIPSNATDLTFVVPPPIFTAAPSEDWTSDCYDDWSSWTADGGADWTPTTTTTSSTTTSTATTTLSLTTSAPPYGYPAYDAWGHPYGTPLYSVAKPAPWGGGEG